MFVPPWKYPSDAPIEETVLTYSQGGMRLARKRGDGQWIAISGRPTRADPRAWCPLPAAPIELPIAIEREVPFSSKFPPECWLRPENISMPDSVWEIILQTCKDFEVPPIQLFSPLQTKAVARTRAEAMRRVREIVRIAQMKPSYPQIGRWFNRDHTSVLYAIREAEKRLQEEEIVR